MKDFETANKVLNMFGGDWEKMLDTMEKDFKKAISESDNNEEIEKPTLEAKKYIQKD